MYGAQGQEAKECFLNESTTPKVVSDRPTVWSPHDWESGHHPSQAWVRAQEAEVPCNTRQSQATAGAVPARREEGALM